METNWVVLTGAPSSGKTAVLNYLGMLGYRTTPEVARAHIENELSKGLTIEELRKDEGAFQRSFINRKLRLEENLNPEELIFMDRAMPDSITYYKLAKLNPLEVQCEKGVYKAVFILDCLPFVQDSARTENLKEIKFLNKWLEKDYKSLGYNVVRIPVDPIEQRAEMIIRNIDL